MLIWSPSEKEINAYLMSWPPSLACVVQVPLEPQARKGRATYYAMPSFDDVRLAFMTHQARVECTRVQS